MALKKELQDALNKQLNAEMYSAYLYLSMSAYFESQNLKGFASWMKIQAHEEMTHAMRFYDHINERGGKVLLTEIKAPETSWESPLAVFEDTYKHEKIVTSLIHDLVDLARKEKDHAAENFLKWFVEEQVEEEASADEILQKLRMIKGSGHGLLLLDSEMGKRSIDEESNEAKE